MKTNHKISDYNINKCLNQKYTKKYDSRKVFKPEK